MPYTISPMTEADYDEALALWQRTEGMGLHADADSPEGIARFLRRNPGMSFIARHDVRLIGTVLCGHDGRAGSLHHLAVDASFRRRGIGNTLVERCVAALQAEGIARCNLFVYAENAEGQRFWDRRGWTLRTDTVRMQWVQVREAQRVSDACGQ